MKKWTIFILLLAITFTNVVAQNWNGYSSVYKRQMEYLDRGLVAVKTNTGVFLSWRFLGNDDRNVKFNVYRDNVKLNSEPLKLTNYTDASGIISSTYKIGVVVSGAETEITSAVTVWEDNYKTLQLNRPTSVYEGCNYYPNDCSVGDLDGDGEYELIVKWDPGDATPGAAKDNYHPGITDKVYLDAYKLDGTFMWRIDLGINIRAGAHYTQFLVYDFDGDGKAELVCMTAPGSKDGLGENILLGNDNADVDYRNSVGRITTGSEYLTIFNGETGANLNTIPFAPARGTLTDWGDVSTVTSDYHGNFSYRFLACVAYLDGVRPSIVMTRGYYQRAALAAFDFENGKLQQRWLYDSGSADGTAKGQGNHNIAVADVDGDGYDEIIFGSCVIDHNGTLKSRTGMGHGDALHVSDIDPDRPGYEVFHVTESSGKYNHFLYDPNTGAIIWHSSNTADDNGRGFAADLDPNHRGFELSSNKVDGVYNCKGVKISDIKPSLNFRIYWDGDLQDELLDGTQIQKWYATQDRATLLEPVGLSSCNGTKATPNLSADIFGDWREEVIWYETADPSKIRIYTTTTPTEHRLYTLMHDPVYRLGIAWQNVAYNQPPHLGFYMGDGLDNIPYPKMFTYKDGVPKLVNLLRLESAITEAQSLYDTSEKGANTLQYPADAFDVLLAAITTANNFLNSVNRETPMDEGQDAIDTAETTLRDAMAAFKAKQILVFANPDPTVFYSIYSYGKENSANVPTTDTQKRFLTASGSSLVYQIGTTDNEEVSTIDPIRKQQVSQWQIIAIEGKSGFVNIRNRETGKYMQASGTLSDNPVEVYLPYKAKDNGKLGYAIFNAANTICLQIHENNSVITSSGYADRSRMRFVIEEVLTEKSKLKATIAEAKSLYDNSEKGSDLFQYPENAFNELNTAIITAQNFLSSITLETEDSAIEAAETELRGAINNFKAKQILTFSNPNSNAFYNIYSYGTADARDDAATTSMTKKFLSTSGTTLVYQTGTTDANEVDNSDPIRKKQEAQWQITASSTKQGFVTIKNRETDKYMQISGTLSDNPVEICLQYKKEENSKHAFSVQVSDVNADGESCLQIAKNSVVEQTGYASRLRMRWIIDESEGIETGLPSINNAKVVISNEYFDLLGRRVSKETKGILIEIIKYQDGTAESKKMIIQ